MKRESKRKVCGGLMLSLLLAGAGFAVSPRQNVAPVELEAIKPPRGLVVLFRARAEGVQIYKCQRRADNASQFAWALKGPRADLFDDRGDKIGTHYAGPYWEAMDGSKVRGVLKGQGKAPDTT